MPKSSKFGKGLIVLPLLVLLLACEKEQSTDAAIGAQGNTPATSATIMANAKVREDLNLGDQTDFEDARRGLIAVPTALEVAGPGDSIVWDMPSYDFIQGEAPDTVNPSLWRQATLNNNHGLFEVTDGVYQLRGFDLSNMSIIEGQTGWIIVDPLTTKETAAAAIAFAKKHLGDRPISAIIFTHSHIDHFGGVLSVLDAKDETEIFETSLLDHIRSENVIAGSTMSRRSMYMYGSQLEHSEKGHVGSGLGKGPALWQSRHSHAYPHYRSHWRSNHHRWG